MSRPALSNVSASVEQIIATVRQRAPLGWSVEAVLFSYAKRSLPSSPPAPPPCSLTPWLIIFPTGPAHMRWLSTDADGTQTCVESHGNADDVNTIWTEEVFPTSSLWFSEDLQGRRRPICRVLSSALALRLVHGSTGGFSEEELHELHDAACRQVVLHPGASTRTNGVSGALLSL